MFRGAVDVALIAEQWDPLARLAASLRNRTAPDDGPARRELALRPAGEGLTMLGRVVKTIYILRYAHDAELRAPIRRQLNRRMVSRRRLSAHHSPFVCGEQAIRQAV